MPKLTKAKALKMSKDERRAFMAKLHADLKAGKITREQFEIERKPINDAIVAEF